MSRLGNCVQEWTGERISLLRTLHGEGHSYAEIGRRMGITKNTAVGMAHRLCLPSRQLLIVQSAAVTLPVAVPVPVQAAPIPVVPVQAAPVQAALAATGRHRPVECCWPTTGADGKHRMLCEGLTVAGSPYCAEHRSRAVAGVQLKPQTQAKLAAIHG